MQERSIQRERLSETVVAKIKAYILDHALGEGDRLPTEQELATLCGVSRISVREATKALSFLGIIHAAPRRGLTVGRVNMRRVTEYLGFHFALSDYPRDQLLKTRVVIETGALPAAMERIAADDAVFQRLMDQIDEHAKVRDPDAFIQHDLAFHRMLLELSAIEPLLAFNDLLEVFFRRFREEVVATRPHWPKGLNGHRQIVKTLRARQADRAIRLLRTHLEYYKGHV
jgi:GntR family transcriptional regulator, transcriptional repressor for pyruvate dehydrogenase complex